MSIFQYVTYDAYKTIKEKNGEIFQKIKFTPGRFLNGRLWSFSYSDRV
jgi:hypothetical protein